MLGTDEAKIIHSLHISADLLRLHQIARHALADELDNAAEFGAKFFEKAPDVIKTKDLSDDEKKTLNLATATSQKVKEAAQQAANSLRQPFKSYDKDKWQSNANAAEDYAADFKINLGNIIKTDFTSPYDSIIGSNLRKWLKHIDFVTEEDKKVAASKLVFNSFIAQHPGLEHFAGVCRGGTFVLVYDESNQVIADFMLPYRWADIEAPVTEEKLPASTVSLQPPYVTRPPIRIEPKIEPPDPSRDPRVLELFNRVKGEIEVNAQMKVLATTQEAFAILSRQSAETNPSLPNAKQAQFNRKLEGLRSATSKLGAVQKLLASRGFSKKGEAEAIKKQAGVLGDEIAKLSTEIADEPDLDAQSITLAIDAVRAGQDKVIKNAAAGAAVTSLQQSLFRLVGK